MRRRDSWPDIGYSGLSVGRKSLTAGSMSWSPVRTSTAKPATIIQNARSQAKRKGGQIRTRTLTDGDRVAIVIQYQAGTA